MDISMLLKYSYIISSEMVIISMYIIIQCIIWIILNLAPKKGNHVKPENQSNE